MTEEDREYYIAVLLIAYPFKSEDYFRSMPDRRLIEEYERMQSIT